MKYLFLLMMLTSNLFAGICDNNKKMVFQCMDNSSCHKLTTKEREMALKYSSLSHMLECKCYSPFTEYNNQCINIRYLFKKSLLYKYYPKLASLIQDINKGQIFFRKEYKPCIKDGVYLDDKKINKPYLKEIKQLKFKILKARKLIKKLQDEDPVFNVYKRNGLFKTGLSMFTLPYLKRLEKRLKNKDITCSDLSRSLSKPMYMVYNPIGYLEIAYNLGIKIDKNYKEAIRLNNLGHKYYQKKNYLRAFKNWKKAIKKYPRLAIAHYNLACVMNIIRDKENKELIGRLPTIEEIIKYLKISIKYKKDRLKRMQEDSDLKSLYDNPLYKELLKE